MNKWQNTHPSIRNVFTAEGLAEVRLPDVKAVIYCPPNMPDWYFAVTRAVASGGFCLDKKIVEKLTFESTRAFLEQTIPEKGLGKEMKEALVSDTCRLVEICRKISGANEFNFRCLAAPPNHKHGYHIDISNGGPAIRILKVYGSGTEFVDPANVTSPVDFFRHVYLRKLYADRLQKKLGENLDKWVNLDDPHLAVMDETPIFIKDSSKLFTVPQGAIVAIKTTASNNLYASSIASGHANGWIHRSPSKGLPRLVITINGAVSQG